MLAPYVEVRGPGAMVNFHGKHSLALTSRLRGMNQFNNFDRSLYQTITDPDFSAGGNIDLTSKNFNYTAHIWSELGLSYGVVLLDAEDSRVKAGITLRYLGGIGYVGLKGVNLDAHFRAGNDSFYAENSDVEFASNILSTRNALVNGFSNNSLLSQFFGAKTGGGLGADAGLVYELINNKKPGRDYLLRLSASVIDLGRIKYKQENNFNAEVTGNGYITGNGLVNNVRSYEDFRTYVVGQGFRADTVRRDTKVYMPTRLVLGGDYNLRGNYYINATFVGNLAYRQNFGNSYYNQLTVTPRYDTRLLSIGVPVTYSGLTNSLRAGLGIRFSGFFVGSDDMLALVVRKQYGFNFYVGGFVPFNMHKGGTKRCVKDAADDADAGMKEEETDMDNENSGKADSTDNSLNYMQLKGATQGYARVSGGADKTAGNDNRVPVAAIVSKKEFTEQRH
jgi:hypothetical protein